MYAFAILLVLYEFTVYSANDMIMPGMLQVVQQFHVAEYYVAASLSFYILGNCAFILIAGFIAEIWQASDHSSGKFFIFIIYDYYHI